MSLKKNILLGQMLVEKELIDEEELDKGLEEHRKTGEFIGAALVKLGFVKESELLPILSEQLGIEYVSLKDIKVDHKVVKKVPAKFACHYKLVPLKIEKNALKVAVMDPLDIHTLDDLKLLLGFEIIPVLAAEKDILEGINRYYGIGAELIEKMTEAASQEKSFVEAKAAEGEDSAEGASIIKLVNQIVEKAYAERATDIHIEPFEDELRVRYRIDGVLYDASFPPTIKHFKETIVSRIKIMAAMDIAEKRLPQDGRFKIKLAKAEIDLRVSILPTRYGEAVDIRILAKEGCYGLESLGLEEENLTIFNSLIKMPYGIVFVTGPTGSGKTTTLYACLDKINSKERKILTIEDPIEYELKGIIQIQVHPKIGLNFSTGLRSILRHDPDVMMVGEVRDVETAEIAIRSALTGHFVFSTLHTNDAAGGAARLLDMGIESYLVASSVVCFIAQRLVRFLCPNCKSRIRAPKEILEELGIGKVSSESEIYESKGCEKCMFTGYKGRVAIFELLVISDKIRELIGQRTTANKIKEQAVREGMKTLRQDGWYKVLKGITTVEEVLRVTQTSEM